MVESLTGIVTLIEEIDQLCAKAERELVARDWKALGATLNEQRRALAALTNAVYATRETRTPHFNDQLRKRIARIYAIRDNQLKRLTAFRDVCRSRLTVIARAKQARHSLVRPKRPSSVGLNAVT